MDSIKEIFKIGYGPSSSHTMGPAFASKIFLNRNPQADFFEVTLFGSLALTGKGHLTDKAIKETFAPSDVDIIFNKKDIYDYHPNAMKFKAFKVGELIDEWLVFSVGGGSLKELGESRANSNTSVYRENSMNQILEYVNKKHLNFPEYILEVESSDTRSYLENVLTKMEEVAIKGLSTNGTLPGRLQIKRKASMFYEKYEQTKDPNLLTYALALASAEENASGNVIVTAPTCGSCGVVPAVILTEKMANHVSQDELVKALMVAGLIGNLAKSNASISGAEVGCQGEIGVACSMASAALTYLLGGTPEQIESAAEIALEHHLGMTCDPIDGMVQIPCIERNALSAQYARNVANYALMLDGKHNVTLDSVLEVMKETGKDLHQKYRETSTGGLALRAGGKIDE